MRLRSFMLAKPTIIVTVRKPLPRRFPSATVEATLAFPRIVDKPPVAGVEISIEENTRRGDAAEELFR